MAVMRLHHGRHGYVKRARSLSMPTSEAVGLTCLGYTGERALGARPASIIQDKAVLPCRYYDDGWKVSYVFRGGVV